MQVTAGIILILVVLGAMFALMVALNAFDRKQKQLFEALESRYFPSTEKQEPAELQQDNPKKDSSA